MPLGISSTIITISGHNETKICQSVFTTFLGGFTRRINRHLPSCQLISLYKGIPVEMVSTRNHQLTSRRPEENWQLSTLSHSTFYGHKHSLRSLKQVSFKTDGRPICRHNTLGWDTESIWPLSLFSFITSLSSQPKSAKRRVNVFSDRCG